MMIRARVIEIPRVKILPPNDGVHRASNATGYLKGCHSFIFRLPDGSEHLVPKGQTGFWWQHKPDVGIKVFYKIEDWHRAGKKAVNKAWRNRMALASSHVMPKTHKVVKVRLDLTYRHEHHTTWARGIVTDAVHWPAKAWADYARGYPYDFDCLDPAEHPLHTPQGYKRFADRAYKACKKAGVTVCGGDKRPKLGDISYCVERRRWFLVDDG